MSEAATKLLDQILQLPELDRQMIADRLWESLELDGDIADDPEFQAELERRLASVADGTAVSIPWEQAREEIRTELVRRRSERNQGGCK